MHEYGLMEAVVSRAREECHGHERLEAQCIRIEVGQFALASRESLETAFEILTRGTELEGASLEIVEVPGRAVCDACGFAGSPADLGLGDDEPPVPMFCPTCGFPLAVTEGAGVTLTEVRLRDRGGSRPADRDDGRR